MKRAVLLACLLVPCVAAHLAAQEPVNPFKPRKKTRADSRPGTVTMSNGDVYKGQIYVTRDKRLRVFDTAAKLYRDIPLVAMKEIEITVEKEGMEKEWRWKEGGSNVKVYTGKAYPWREYLTTVTLTNDQKITGHLKATPVYVETGGKKEKLIIHGKNKGELGQKLSDLVYIKKIVFGEPNEK
ncbi:MAG: hypothetical protein GXP25_21175 [Planctomycetes bacterium]|nr:hypothetical protein [Planctomycetota bacterium]